jgi:hypothetical protein
LSHQQRCPIPIAAERAYSVGITARQEHLCGSLDPDLRRHGFATISSSL